MGDVRGYFLGPPHGTAPTAVTTKNIKLSSFKSSEDIQKKEDSLSPYLTGMRRIRDCFANRFAKPSPNVRRASQSPRMHRELVANGRELFAKVLNM